jgi:hypothetical protein
MTESVRKVQTGEDTDGNPIYEYQFGASIEGGFVPFVTKSAGYVEHLAARDKAQQEQAQASEGGQPTEATTTAPSES